MIGNTRNFKTIFEPSLVFILASILSSLALANIEGAKVHSRSSQFYPDYDEDDFVTNEQLMKPKECKGFTCPFQKTCGRAELNPLTPKGNQKGYIWGGKDATYGEWPSFAELEIHDYHNLCFCGGVLITNKHILTAAHCVTNDEGETVRPKTIKVILGGHKMNIKDRYEEQVGVRRVCIPTSFFTTPSMMIHDYAVLTLENEIKLNKHVQPACLPYNYKPIGERMRNSTATEPKCFAVGLGLTANSLPDVIQKMAVHKVSCDPEFGIEGDDRSRHCFRKVGGKGDTCDGDSGGPILCLNPETKRWTISGLASYGLETCAKLSKSWISVYTRVPALLQEMHEECGI